MNAKEFIQREIAVINRTLREFGVNAGTHQKLVKGSPYSHLAYYIVRGHGVKVSDVTKVFPEMVEAVREYRRRTPFARQSDPKVFLAVRPCSDGLGIETSPPIRREMPLLNYDGLQTIPAHHMLAGRSFGHAGQQDELVDLNRQPHVLVAGVTNAGKTVVVHGLVSTLAYNTSPAELKLVVIDLKNIDLAPFEDLPHVELFAGDEEAAVKAIKFVWDELQRRRSDRHHRPHRLVLVVDEAAQLADIKVNGELFKTSDAVELPKTVDLATILGKIISIGRSLGINLIVATQHPTSEGGLGGMMKANFPVRLVGMVATKEQAYPATQINMSGAESLPGQGSFLRIHGGDAWRFQSFNVTEDELSELVQVTRRRWMERLELTGYGTGYEPDITGYALDMGLDTTGYIQHIQSPTTGEPGGSANSAFPIGKFRALTDAERAIVVRMSTDHRYQHNGKLSLRRLTTDVYGSYCPKRAGEIRQALDADRATDTQRPASNDVRALTPAMPKVWM